MADQQPTDTSSSREVIDLTEAVEDVDVSEVSDQEGKTAEDVQPVVGAVKKKKKRTGKRKNNRKSKKKQTDDQDAGDLSDTDTIATVLLSDSEKLAPFPRAKKLDNGKGKAKVVKNVYVQVVPHYKFRPLLSSKDHIASKHSDIRDQEYGIFATKTIAQGTRIICEPALITLPLPGDQLEGLMEAYEKLPKHEQDRIWALKPSPLSKSPQLQALGQRVEPLILRALELLLKHYDSRTDNENITLEAAGLLVKNILATVRIAARWHASRYSLVQYHELKNTPGGTNVTGLFVETAGLRHSCVPNCYANYNKETDRMTVHTTRPIAANEELTLSNLPSVYYQIASERTEQLDAKFGITCTCAACDTSHADYTKHERARLRIATRVVQLNQFLSLLDICDSSTVLRKFKLTNDFRPDDGPELVDYTEAEQLCLDIVADLRLTGCEGIEVVRWLNVLVDKVQQPEYVNMLVNTEKGIKMACRVAHAGTAIRVAEGVLGGDSSVIGELVKRKERIESEFREME